MARVGHLRVLPPGQHPDHLLGLRPAQLAVRTAEHQGRAPDLRQLLPVRVEDPGGAGGEHLPAGEDGPPSVGALPHHLGEEFTAGRVGALHPGVVLAEPLPYVGQGGERHRPGAEPVLPLPLRGRAERGGPHVADDQGPDEVGALRGELPGGERSHRMPDEGDGGEAELFDRGLGVGDVRLAGVRPLGRLLAAAVSTLVEADRPVPLGEPAGGGSPVGGPAHQSVEQ